MRYAIPTTFGLLTLSVAGTGCSDAQKVASSFEKVCKAECECPSTLEYWNEISNCKQACSGYATIFQASIKDQAEGDPCGDLDKILSDMKRCTDSSCGMDRDECLYQAYDDLYECWPDVFGYYYYYNHSPDDSGEVAGVSSDELVQQLMRPIPGALDRAVMHSATAESTE